MSVSQKQTVEIVKVLYRGADILILDEPTAVLTPQETEKLFTVLRNMRDSGKAIVIITHKMHEVESISDRVAILRKGQYVGEKMTKDTNAQEMTNMMVGHTVALNIERPEPVSPKPNNPKLNTHANMAIIITFFIPNFFRQKGISSMQQVSLICDNDIRILAC
jgi:simple sugar transport system ATP-binding protein